MSNIKEPSWLVRVVERYSNETDELTGEYILPEVGLSELQQVWNAAPTDPMVESFSIDPKQAQFLRGLAEIDFDFEQYSYFMSAYTTDWTATKQAGGYMGLFPPPRALPAFPDAKRVMPKTAS
jgi:hypothetical protein